MGGILRFSLLAFPLEVNNVDHLNFDVCLVLYLSSLVFFFLLSFDLDYGNQK